MESERQVPQDLCASCSALVQAVRLKLAGLGYNAGTLRDFDVVWRKLITFAGNEVFSRDLAERFLSSLDLPPDVVERPFKLIARRAKAIAAIRALLRHIGGQPFAIGTHPLRRLPRDLEGLLQDYVHYCTQHRNHRPLTIHARVGAIRRFLAFTAMHDVPDLRSLRIEHIAAFLKHCSPASPLSLASVNSRLKSFLRYLWVMELIPCDLSLGMPRIRIPEDPHIPKVWTEQEVAAILSAVDRESALGKRDYAILLLACKLGLRAKDIVELCLDNLHWEEARIDIVQSKTGSPLAVPLLDDVGDALIDYLRHGRPPSACRRVFLRAKAPIGPIVTSSALTYLMNRTLRRAAVPAGTPYRGSLHSFRHTLATRLLRNNATLHVVSAVLGHTSMDSTRIYTKVDLRALRSVALDPDRCLSTGDRS